MMSFRCLQKVTLVARAGGSLALSSALLFSLGCTARVDQASSRDHGSVTGDDAPDGEREADSGVGSTDAAGPGSTPTSGAPSEEPTAPTVSEPPGSSPVRPAVDVPNMDASTPVVPSQPDPPANEPSVVDNRGVWILAGVVAHGLGDEWEYHTIPALGVDVCWGRGFSMWGSSETDVWLVGAFASHFDGTKFTNSALDEPWGELTSTETCWVYGNVWGTSPNDVWAAAPLANNKQMPLAHFDGERWEQLERPEADLFDIWASSSGDVWVGSGSGLHLYDGTTWTLDPERVGTVWGSATNDVWVGMRWHYDGERWTEHEVPNLSDQWRSAASQIRGSESGDVWAWPSTPYRFREGAWQPVDPPPDPVEGAEALWIDFFATKKGLWAVGYSVIPPERMPSELSAYPTQSHVMFYDGAAWTDVTPSAILSSAMTNGATPGAIWVNED